MSLTVGQLALIAAATFIGATVQGSTGIGFSLLAGPALIAVDPAFAPAPLLMAGFTISARHVVRERAHIDRSAVFRLVLGAPVGLAIGAAVVTAIDPPRLRLVIGIIVVVTAIGLLAGLRPRRTPITEVAGGATTAFTTVTAALPGPPLAMTLHDAPPARTRATIGAVAGTLNITSLVILALIGRLGPGELARAALLLPFLAAGLLLAARLRSRIEGSRFATVVLVLAGAGGLSLVVGNL